MVRRRNGLTVGAAEILPVVLVFDVASEVDIETGCGIVEMHVQAFNHLQFA